MNLNLINLSPSEWSKTDWTDAYSQALLGNICAGMSKQEYYDFVMANYKTLEERDNPLSQELKDKWTAGRKSVQAWTKWRDCDIDGVLLKDIQSDKYQDQIDELKTDLSIFEHNTDLTKSIASKVKKW